MKKLLILALMIGGSSAFATKARYDALGHAAHIVDVKSIFRIPTDMMSLPESMEFNFGTTYAADGGMIKNHGDSKLGFFVGNLENEQRATGYLAVDNPFTVLYAAKAGDMDWGVGFTYSSSSKKAGTASTDDQTQSYMGLNGSVVMGDTTLALNLGLADKAKGNGSNDSYELTKTPMGLDVYHKIGDWTAYFNYSSNTSKTKEASETKTTESAMALGAVNTMKSEGADFFYGFAYWMGDVKISDIKASATILPMIFGIETDAASWLTLRGSITQNVLLGSTKITGGSSPSGADSIDHNTTVNAGMGFKFTKSTLDITLSSATSGTINGSSFGANAGMTYLF